MTITEWRGHDQGTVSAFAFQPVPQPNPFVRIHSRCLYAEVMDSIDCDCAGQLKRSIEIIKQNGGILIYLDQEGRGAGLLAKAKAYHLYLAKELDTVEAYNSLGITTDKRVYEPAAWLLRRYFKIQSARLITNNPSKLQACQSMGIAVTQVATSLDGQGLSAHGVQYLKVKKAKLGHITNDDVTL